VEKAFYGKKMEKIIYIQLLNEGSVTYRPVPACEVENNIFKLNGFEIYDPEDEEWEFEPGALVFVEEQTKDKQKVLIAVNRI
jgi:hypothetical protein